MAINKKYVSLESLLEGIYINAGYQYIDWNEAMFHIGRLFSKMGIVETYVEKITDGSEGNIEPIVVDNYQAYLPDDLMIIKGIRDYDTKLTLIENSDMYYLNPQIVHNFFTSPAILEEVLPAKNDSVTLIANRFTPSYKINNNTIHTNIKDMKLEIAYYAVPTDDRGYPLIPDDEKIKEAIEYTIIERLDYKAMRQGKLTRDIYKHSEQSKYYAVAAAITNAAMPSVDQAQAIINSWMRMIPSTNSHRNGFANENIAERRRLH